MAAIGAAVLPKAPAAEKWVVTGTNAYGEEISVEFFEVQLGYTITRQAIDHKLYKNTFGWPGGTEVKEWIAANSLPESPRALSLVPQQWSKPWDQISSLSAGPNTSPSDILTKEPYSAI